MPIESVPGTSLHYYLLSYDAEGNERPENGSLLSRRLLEANLYNKLEYVEEVARLLGELSEAWEAIGTSGQPGSGLRGALASPDSSVSGSLRKTLTGGAQ